MESLSLAYLGVPSATAALVEGQGPFCCLCPAGADAQGRETSSLENTEDDLAVGLYLLH